MFNLHYKLEKYSIRFVIAIIIASAVGGLMEIAPLFTIHQTVERDPDMRVYTPLELAGRNIYIREGCYACHSQMIRTLKDDVDRYGHYSLAVESKYDHPMLWGSKRTGPDIARVGEKYSDAWQVRHLINPRDVVPESVMPQYAFLAETQLDTENLDRHLAAQKKLGVPYTDDMIKNASRDAYGQSAPDSDAAAGVTQRYGEATHMRPFDGKPSEVTEMDALVAYLQVLGKLSNAAKPEKPVAAVPATAQQDKEKKMLHDKLLFVSKYYGLLYLVIFSTCVLAYALWPENKAKFDKAASSIIDDAEDRPSDER